MWRDGEMLYELGTVWGALGEFKRAAERLGEAVRAEDGLAPFRAAEQWANFEDRAIRAGAEKITDELRGQWNEVEQRLEKLKAIAETRERWSIQAGSEKRRGEIARGRERDALFKKSAQHYHKAYQLSVENGTADPYPALNWLTLRFLTETGRAKKRMLADLERLREMIDQRAAAGTGGEVWVRMHQADAMLLLHLIRGDLHQAGKKNAEAPLNLIMTAYSNVLDAGATKRDRDSAVRQIEFIQNSLKVKKITTPNARATIAALDKIRDSIKQRD